MTKFKVGDKIRAYYSSHWADEDEKYIEGIIRHIGPLHTRGGISGNPDCVWSEWNEPRYAKDPDRWTYFDSAEARVELIKPSVPETYNIVKWCKQYYDKV